MQPKKLICIACSIFKNELEGLLKEAKINIPVILIDSMLHMKPDVLEQKLGAEIIKYGDCNIILAFGECNPGMNEIENIPNIRRIQGLNCCNILLGLKRYNQLRAEGAFILINEWIERWEDIFKNQLGFKKADTMQLFMKEMHTKLVYLDTGIVEVPYETLQVIAEYCDLPFVVEKCSSAFLAEAINDLSNVFDYER